jgi:hypothetical protein
VALRDVIKELGRRSGLEISHYRPLGRRRAKQLDLERIATVLDVGANVGQYARELRHLVMKATSCHSSPSRTSSANLKERHPQTQTGGVITLRSKIPTEKTPSTLHQTRKLILSAYALRA